MKEFANSNLGKALGVLILAIASSVGTKFATDTPKKGGNLDIFINGDYTSYKEWASNYFSTLENRVRELELYKAKEEGAEAEARDYRRDNQFIKEYHKGKEYFRNTLTGVLYVNCLEVGRTKSLTHNGERWHYHDRAAKQWIYDKDE